MTQPHNRIALDIEGISTVDDRDFDNPAHWIAFAVALGYSDGDTTEVDVLFREDSTLQAETALLNDMIGWIAERTAPNRDILTYNGESYDLPIIQHRSRRIDDNNPGENVTQRLGLLLDTSTHIDLIQDMREREGTG